MHIELVPRGEYDKIADVKGLQRRAERLHRILLDEDPLWIINAIRDNLIVDLKSAPSCGVVMRRI